MQNAWEASPHSTHAIGAVFAVIVKPATIHRETFHARMAPRVG
jgi:hypothetical protein